MPGGRGRPAGPLLSRSQIVGAAVAVADTSGVAKVTMRSVADHLGVAAMSLYHYVPSKDALLDALVDCVFEQISAPEPAAGWRAAVEAYARSAHDVLLRHPWALGLVNSRRTPGPATLGHHDAVLGCLRLAGFTLPMSAHTIALLDSYVHGFVLQETNLPLQSPQDVSEVAAQLGSTMIPGAFPHLEEMIRDHALQPGYSFAAEFDWGLQLILDALERIRCSQRPAQQPPSPVLPAAGGSAQ